VFWDFDLASGKARVSRVSSALLAFFAFGFCFIQHFRFLRFDVAAI